MMRHPALAWTLAVILTLAAAAYQRMTGPTHPRRVEYERAGGGTLRVRLPRSHGGPGGCPVSIEVPDREIEGTIRFRRYPTDEPWRELPMRRVGDRLQAELPHQPPAGKLEYVVELRAGGEPIPSDVRSASVIRFKGAVAAGVLIPHIVCMFLMMLFGTRAGLAALVGAGRDRLWAVVAFALLVAGGLVLGPIVQKMAFGDWWTGVPFGWDLTDNKIAVAFLVWAGALAANARRRRPAWIVLAAAVTLVVMVIPHSALGSELDPATGKVVTG